jgi:hypothetical protein
MLFINEWLPNPSGDDAVGEWVELFNDGNASVNIGGWLLKTGGASKYNLKGTIGAGEYLVLRRADTKLVLRNTDEKLFLYDVSGNLVDQSAFFGSAPEGESFARTGYDPKSPTQQFAWSEPSPGYANKISLNTNIFHNAYPAGVPLNKNIGSVEFWSMMLGAAAVLTALVVFVLKRNENLSNLFFRRDEKIR